MKKTLYSLMLSDDVVREIDALAHRQGTSRSSLINQILAEHVDLVTPERRIRDIFSQMEALLLGDRELVPHRAPNAMSLSLKSSLQYRYRPTVRYSVELFCDHGGALGELSATFRTQSAELLAAMERYFLDLKSVETELVAPLLGGRIDYALYGGRFTRSLCLSHVRGADAHAAAAAISAYVRLFDALMKRSLAGADRRSLRSAYIQWLAEGNAPV